MLPCCFSFYLLTLNFFFRILDLHQYDQRWSSQFPFWYFRLFILFFQLQICLYHPHPNQPHRYTRQIIRINNRTTCREVLTNYIPQPNTASLIETCLGFGKSSLIKVQMEWIVLEREILPNDCLFDVITRNQAIEEFKIVVRRIHGMYTLVPIQIQKSDQRLHWT